MSGIQIFGGSNQLQIDANYRNYFLREKIYLEGEEPEVTGVNSIRYSIYTRTVTVSGYIGAPPLVFIGIGAEQARVYPWGVKDLGNGRWELCFYGTINKISEECVLYLYGPALPASNASGFGLQVFDASGTTVFDSAQQPLVIYRIDDTSGDLSVPNSKLQTARELPTKFAVNYSGGLFTERFSVMHFGGMFGGDKEVTLDSFGNNLWGHVDQLDYMQNIALYGVDSDGMPGLHESIVLLWESANAVYFEGDFTWEFPRWDELWMLPTVKAAVSDYLIYGGGYRELEGSFGRLRGIIADVSSVP